MKKSGRNRRCKLERKVRKTSFQTLHADKSDSLVIYSAVCLRELCFSPPPFISLRKDNKRITAPGNGNLIPQKNVGTKFRTQYSSFLSLFLRKA